MPIIGQEHGAKTIKKYQHIWGGLYEKHDALDRVSEICYTVNGNGEKYIYEYTSDGNIHFVESTENLRRYVYDYDTSGRCIGIYEFTGTKDNQLTEFIPESSYVKEIYYNGETYLVYAYVFDHPDEYTVFFDG